MAMERGLRKPSGPAIGLVELSSIARGMQDDTSVKHRVKRAGRFVANTGVSTEQATACLAKYLLRPNPEISSTNEKPL